MNNVGLTMFAIVEEMIISAERCDIIFVGHRGTGIWPHS